MVFSSLTIHLRVPHWVGAPFGACIFGTLVAVVLSLPVFFDEGAFAAWPAGVSRESIAPGALDRTPTTVVPQIPDATNPENGSGPEHPWAHLPPPRAESYAPVLRAARQRQADPTRMLTVYGDLPFTQAATLAAAGAWPKDAPLPPDAWPAPIRDVVGKVQHGTIWILAFARAPNSAEREAIAAAGGRIVGYQPMHAYTVLWHRPNPDLSGIPGIHAAFPRPPGLALSPGLARATAENHWPQSSTAEIGGEPLLHVLTWPGTRLDAVVTVARAVGALPGKALDDPNTGVPPWTEGEIPGAVQTFHTSHHPFGPQAAVFRVRRDRFALLASALATLPEVMRIEPRAIPTLMNSGSSILLQAGHSRMGHRPLFERGLTGFGQIYAAVDSGLDTDACQARFSSHPSDQTLALHLRPPGFEVTDPFHKVIAYYVLPGAQEYDEGAAGMHGTLTTGCAAGDNYRRRASRDDPGLDEGDGMAPAAQVVFQDVGNVRGQLVGLSYSSQTDIHLQSLYSGATIHNDSYGIDTDAAGSLIDANAYDGDSRMIDDIAWATPDYVVVFAAGNSGPAEGTLGGEGSTAKHTLAVGATLPGWARGGGDDLVSFSSRGPTTDGRLKPDLVAPGIVISATEDSPIEVPGVTDAYGRPATRSQTDPPNNQCALTFAPGTSFASPTAAGMAILVRQYFTDGFYPGGARNPADARTPSGALVKAVMLAANRNLPGGVIQLGFGSNQPIAFVDPLPSTHQGWGRPALDDALYFSGDERDMRVLADVLNGSPEAVVQGDTRVYELSVLSDRETLVLSLVWNDPGGDPQTGAVLVNDLDLRVVSPTGAVYLGNVGFKNAWQLPAGPLDGPDPLNPAEMIRIQRPTPGTWRIEVGAPRVPGDGGMDPFDSTRQGFALLAVGDFDPLESPEPGQPFLTTVRFLGGCDDDEFLDLNETATLIVAVANRRGGEVTGLRAEVAVEPAGFPVDPVHVLFPQGRTISYGPLAHRGFVQGVLPVHLSRQAGSASELDRKAAQLRVRLFDARGALIEDKLVDITLHADSRYGAGDVSRQRGECDPAPKIIGIAPGEIIRGTTLARMELQGEALPLRMAVAFDPPKITVGTVERGPAGFGATLVNVAASLDAVPGGYYTLILTDADKPDFVPLKLPRALKVLPNPALEPPIEESPGEADADIEVADAADTDVSDQTPDTETDTPPSDEESTDLADGDSAEIPDTPDTLDNTDPDPPTPGVGRKRGCAGSGTTGNMVGSALAWGLVLWVWAWARRRAGEYTARATPGGF